MIQKTLVTFILLCFTLSGLTQESKQGFNMSVKSGITFANMYGSDVVSETFLNGDNPENFYANHPASDVFKTGLNGGLMIDYRFNEHISLGLGASYIQKGAKINVGEKWNHELQQYEEVKGNIYWNQNFWMFEMPLNIYIPLKQNELYFKAGLFAGVLIKSEEEGDISIANEEYEYVNDRHANQREPGYFIGGGYVHSLPGNKGSLFAEISWSRSIINSIGSGMIPNPQYYFNQTISLNVGYRISL